MNSKRKGSAGEREVADLLTTSGFPACRNEQRFVGGIDNPDISADGLHRFHFEVKRVEHLNLPEAMRQAIRDASGRIPAVIHRRNREQWKITLLLSDWLREVRRDDD